MRVAFLTNDNREIQKKYRLPVPLFGPAPEAVLEGFKLFPAEIEVHVVCCLQQPPVSSPRLLGDNIHYHPLVVPALGWMKTGYQGCIRAVRRKLREIRPDLVHGQGTERDCAVSAVLSGRPNVLTIHGHMARIAEITNARPLSYYWLAARLERFSLRRTQGVIAISSYTRELVSAHARRTWLVPNAVDSSFFAIERRPANPPRVMCVANVSPWKNQTGLIEALEPLARGCSFDLRFAGDVDASSPYGGAFLDRARRQPWCSFLGKLDREQLQQELAAATLVVLPSFEDNCPMVILESAAAGVPVAASRVGGIPDLVRHGETGLLFDPGSQREMRDAVSHILRGSASAAGFAARARVDALRCFSRDIVARQHLDIYAQMLSQA